MKITKLFIVTVIAVFGMMILVPISSVVASGGGDVVFESDSGSGDTCSCPEAGQCVQVASGTCGQWTTSPGYLGGCCRLAPSFCCNGAPSAPSNAEVEVYEEDHPQYKMIQKYIEYELRNDRQMKMRKDVRKERSKK